MSDGRELTPQFWSPDLDEDALREAAHAFGDGLWNSNAEQARRADFLVFASQYLGRPVSSLADFDESTAVPIGPSSAVGRTTRNLTRTLVDTALSRFAKAETRVQFVANGGSAGDAEKSEEATDAGNALIEQTGSEQELRRAALHACVFDLGVVKQVDGSDGPEVEHVASWEMMFDPADARGGKPSIRVQRSTSDKEALIARFLSPVEGEDQEAADARQEKIDKLRSGGGPSLSTPDHTQTEQHAIVYELWRDPIGRNPGRHVVVTDAVLLGVEWIEPGRPTNAPFVFFGFSEAVIGAYPTSVAAIVCALQLEIDGMAARKSQVIRLMAVPRYLATGGDADTFDAQLRGGSAAIGDIIHAPVGTTLVALDIGLGATLAALTAEEDRAWAKGYVMCGINENSATGTRPNGLNSAPSQREWNQIADDRLSLVSLEYQGAHVDLAVLLVDAVGRMPDFEINVKTANGRFFKKVKLSSLGIDSSNIVIQKYPISALPSSPSGKLAAAGDLLQMGALDKDQFQQIVQLPDLKGELNMNLSSRKATAKLVAKMLATGVAIAPPDCLEPIYALKYVTAQWLDGVAAEPEMDQHRLDLLQAWMDVLGAKLAPPPAPPTPAPGGGAPAPAGGPPGPTAPPDALGVSPVLGGRVGGQPIALQPAGIAPLQNSEFAPPPSAGGMQ